LLNVRRSILNDERLMFNRLVSCYPDNLHPDNLIF
jgi:hypothetical protein